CSITWSARASNVCAIVIPSASAVFRLTTRRTLSALARQGRLASFRIRSVCREFVVLCRRLELFTEAIVAIDGSKFKAVNTRDRNFTQAKMERRLEQIDESIARYLSQLDSADRQGEAVPEAKITRLNEKIATLRQEIKRLNVLNTQMM